MLMRVLALVRPRAQAERLSRILADQDLLLSEVETAVELWQALRTDPSDLVIASEEALSDPPETAIQGILGLPEPPAVVVVRAEDDAETRARLVGAGAEAVIYTGLSDEGIEEIVGALLSRLRRAASRRLAERPSAELASLEAFRSHSPRMQRVLELAGRVVRADSSVLILGETGVGKEYLARAIHQRGPRAAAPFVAVNCGAIVESLMESELFGHEQGAFTGAHRAHRGSFELAHRGTIFLDEIGEMPIHVQVKLLRVLQDRTIRRVGSERDLQVDVRIIAATNRDLAADIKGHRFRPDLYYRIGVVSMEVPPLRERREDIPELVQVQLARLRSRLRPGLKGVSESAMRALMAYEWPGNVRELLNVLERAVLIVEGDRIELSDLPEGMVGAALAPGLDAISAPRAGSAAARAVVDDTRRELAELPLREARQRVLAEFERAYLVAQLEAARGRVGEVARAAGISPRALFDKMKRHGLRKEDFKG